MLAVVPPMLKWPPPIETPWLVSRIAFCTSSTLPGAAMANTSTGLSQVTSLTICALMGG